MAFFYRSRLVTDVYRVQALLKEASIPTLLKNQYINGAIGELPAIDNELELWLLDESWRKRAEALLAEYQAQQPAVGIAWQCSQCAEENEAEFGICWSCNSSRPNE